MAQSCIKASNRKVFPLLPSCVFVLLLFIFICKVLFLFVVIHVFFLTNSYFFQLWHWSWLPDMVFKTAGKLFSLLLLCMFVSVLFFSICMVLILFVFMHVFFLTNSYFFLLIFTVCFLFLFYFPAYACFFHYYLSLFARF